MTNVTRQNTFAIAAVLVAIITVCITVSYFQYKKSNDQAKRLENIAGIGATSIRSAFADKLEPLYANPVRLMAKSIDLDVKVIGVGVADDGSLETPKVWSESGWYRKSSQPGQVGNVIINGHYDDNYGRPAAFWGLKNIKTGDTVYLLDEFGKTHSYEVFSVFHINIQDPERLSVFESDNSESILTLITCGGVWSSRFSTYNQRVIVKARLTSMETVY